MSLQHKILFGYVVLVAVIGSMAATLLHERKRLREIEAETVKIRSVRLDINKAHSRITGLAIRGESVVAWEEADYRDYRRHRLLTDSLLQTLKPHCREYVHPGQIDTLRHLLAEKETHLLRIMQNLDHRDERDSLLATQLPEVAKRATREKRHRRAVRQERRDTGHALRRGTACPERQPDRHAAQAGEGDGCLRRQLAHTQQGIEQNTEQSGKRP